MIVIPTHKGLENELISNLSLPKRKTKQNKHATHDLNYLILEFCG
jgi:hypothetical protein